MTDLIKIPALTRAYLMANRDSAVDRFDVKKFAYGYPISIGGLWGHWKLEETDDATRMDSSGNGYHLYAANSWPDGNDWVGPAWGGGTGFYESQTGGYMNHDANQPIPGTDLHRFYGGSRVECDVDLIPYIIWDDSPTDPWYWGEHISGCDCNNDLVTRFFGGRRRARRNGWNDGWGGLFCEPEPWYPQPDGWEWETFPPHDQDLHFWKDDTAIPPVRHCNKGAYPDLNFKTLLTCRYQAYIERASDQHGYSQGDWTIPGTDIPCNSNEFMDAFAHVVITYEPVGKPDGSPWPQAVAGKCGSGNSMEIAGHQLYRSYTTHNPPGPSFSQSGRDEFTTSFWCKANGDGLSYAVGGSWSVQAQLSGGSYRFVATCGESTITTGYSYSASTWYFVMLTFDGTALRLFINNSEVGNVAGPHHAVGDSYGISLGPLTQYVEGSPVVFDELKIWTYALTADERDAEWNGGAGNCG